MDYKEVAVKLEKNRKSNIFLASEAEELHQWLDEKGVPSIGEDVDSNGPYILPLIDRIQGLLESSPGEVKSLDPVKGESEKNTFLGFVHGVYLDKETGIRCISVAVFTEVETGEKFVGYVGCGEELASNAWILPLSVFMDGRFELVKKL